MSIGYLIFFILFIFCFLFVFLHRLWPLNYSRFNLRHNHCISLPSKWLELSGTYVWMTNLVRIVKRRIGGKTVILTLSHMTLSILSCVFGRANRTRTDTWWILSPFSLPIGIPPHIWHYRSSHVVQRSLTEIAYVSLKHQWMSFLT